MTAPPCERKLRLLDCPRMVSRSITGAAALPALTTATVLLEASMRLASKVQWSSTSGVASLCTALRHPPRFEKMHSAQVAPVWP